MRHAFKLILLAGLVALPSLADAQPPEKKAVEETPLTVPFELLPSRHMVVEVKLNGKGPYRLIFDTGAPMTLINNKIAKDSGVTGAKTKRPAFGVFGMMGPQEAKTLEVGTAKLDRASVIVMDHPTVQAISDVFGPIDGIVGFPFFARFKMTVDYQKKELTLVPNGYKPADIMESLTAKLMAAQQNKDPQVVAPAAVWGFTLADKEKDDDEAGMTVKAVLDGSAAAAGGLKAGDRVLTIDGRWTDTLADTLVAASLVKAGREVAVVVKRGGKDVKLSVKPTKGV